MSRWFFQQATLSLLISLILGLAMAISHNYALRTVHVHIALTGWMSMGLFAVIYRLFPKLESGWLAKAHFTLYSIGFPVSMVGITLLHTSSPKAGEPLAGIGSVLCVLGALFFTLQVLRNLAKDDPRPQ